jgi:signal transduction histidine kinase
MIFMILKKSPADEVREQMALETKEEKEKSKLLEFLVTEKKITEDVVAQSNYAKDELLFLQGTWRSQIHNIVNDLPETKEMEIYRQIIEPFQNAILAHLRGLEKKLTFDPQLLDLNEIISVIKEELGSELSRLQGRYKIEFSVDHVESTINGKIRCDPYKVVEILRNLIKNSQKAIELKQIELMKMDISKYRSFKPYISVFMKQNDHMAKLIVTDNGGGLPDEYLDKIFKEPIPSSKKKGYGLGTTFIKFFSERMGFTIKGENVQTEQGKGFRVTLEMPFETVHA